VPGTLTGPTVFGLLHDRATRWMTKCDFTCVVVTWRLATDSSRQRDAGLLAQRRQRDAASRTADERWQVTIA
jgi:hypothetical protein